MKRLHIVIVLALVVVLGGLAVAIFRSREPRYHGRTLSAWLEEGAGAPDTSGPFLVNGKLFDPYGTFLAARHGVIEIGTNAIPILLNLLQAKDSPAKENIISWFGKHPSFHIRIRPDFQCHDMAFFGFEALENEAKSAWPTLVQWTSDPDPERRFLVLCCLLATKPDKEIIMPVLRRLEHDPSISVRLEATIGLHFWNVDGLEAKTYQHLEK